MTDGGSSVLWLKSWRASLSSTTKDPWCALPNHLSTLFHPVIEILYKDIVFDNTLGLWVRLYLPAHVSAITTCLPVILYFHGSGFCGYITRNPIFHGFCLKWAPYVGTLIISVDYTLAPKHRVPAAYHDSISALQWLSAEEER